MIDLIIVLIGLILIIYASLDLVGINLLYLIKYLISSDVRRRRSEVREYIEKVLPQRLNLIYNVLLGIRAPDSITPPTTWLMFRESEKPGGKYVWGLGIISLDVPKNEPEDLIPVLDHELTHYVQDVEGLKGPRPYLEGMATYVELRLHGKIRGYRYELRRYLKYVRNSV